MKIRKPTLGFVVAATGSLFCASDRVIFDERVATSIRDTGIVVSAEAFQEIAIVERLRAFATAHSEVQVARLTLATDETTLIQGIGVEQANHWCNLLPPSESGRLFAQVYLIKGSAVAWFVNDGRSKSIQLIGKIDPFTIREGEVEARLVSFRRYHGPPSSDRYSVRLYFRSIVLPSPEVGVHMASHFKESMKFNEGAAIFRVDGFFGCDSGPLSDYLAKKVSAYSKASADAAPYLFCDLAGTPKCQLRSREQDNAEFRREYQQKKTEFIKENERIKRLEAERIRKMRGPR